MLEGNRKQAVATLESLVSKTEKKDLSPLLARLTALHFDRGSPVDAIKTLEEHSAQNPSVKHLLAEAQARNHQYAVALRTVNELLAESPQFAGAHYLAAMLYLHERKQTLQSVSRLPPGSEIDSRVCGYMGRIGGFLRFCRRFPRRRAHCKKRWRQTRMRRRNLFFTESAHGISEFV